MIAYFVDPRPDELFYSIICRYKDHTLSGHWMINEDLFGAGKNIPSNIFYPHHLGNFYNSIGKHFSLTPEDIIQNHTVLPQYFRFTSQEKADRIKRDLIENKPLTIFHRTKSKTTTLKFCPKCLTEDLSTYHEPYWHLSHNTNEFIRICVKHNCFLESWTPPEDKLKMVNLHSAKSLAKIKILPRFNDNPLLLKISEKMVSLLHDTESINKEEIISKAIQKGIIKYSSSKICIVKSQFNEFKVEIRKLDEKYFEQLEHALVNQGFLNKVFSGEHPLLFVLLECLIERLPNKLLRFGDPFKCINKICPKYGQPALHPKSLFNRALKLYPFNGLALIHCKACGMIYRADFSAAKNKKYWRIEYGELFTSRVYNYLNKGHSLSEISRNVDFGWDQLKTLIACDFKRIISQKEPISPAEFLKNRTRHRSIWKNELASKSFISISKSRKKLHPTYKWLLTHDKDWMINFNKSYTKRKGGHSSKKMTLTEEDSFYLDLLIKKKKEFLANDVQKRLNKTLLLNMDEFIPIRIRHRLLPKCTKFLNAECETPFDYNLRQLRKYIKKNTGVLKFTKTFLFNQFGFIVNRLTYREVKDVNLILNPIGHSI